VANSIDFANGVSAFQQGFSFVDQIAHRRRAERKLEERLEEDRLARAHQRSRQDAADIKTNTLFDQSQSDRQEGIDDRELAEKANALMSDPNVDLELLAPYAKFDEVRNFINERLTTDQARTDAETLLPDRGAFEAARMQQQQLGTQGTQSPSDGSLSDQALGVAQLGPQGEVGPGFTQPGTVPAAAIPGDEFATEEAAAAPVEATNRELNLLADIDPVAAQRQRDLQNSQPSALQRTRPGEIPTSGPTFKILGSEQSKLRDEWDAFNEIEDSRGDVLRNMNPTELTKKYFQDRSNLTPEARMKADRRMKAPISAVVVQEENFLRDFGIGGGLNTPEARSARSNLQQAYGLSQEMHLGYRPLKAGGVDSRGLPVNGSNEALTNSVLKVSETAPGSYFPLSAKQARADDMIINRGTKGFVITEPFAAAAFRRWNAGKIDWRTYESMMMTGRAPPLPTEVVEHDPKNDLWRKDANGNEVLVQYGRDPDVDLNNRRNIIDGKGFALINSIASAYNTTDEPTRGTDMVMKYMETVANNENQWAALGYDMSTVNDQVLGWQKFTQHALLKDAYNDELVIDGDWLPDFSEKYGDLSQSMFHPDMQRLIDSGELEIPGTTVLGMSGWWAKNPTMSPLKRRRPEDYARIRSAVPELDIQNGETAEANMDRIDAELLAQGR
jgi:hypothetical protein